MKLNLSLHLLLSLIFVCARQCNTPEKQKKNQLRPPSQELKQLMEADQKDRQGDFFRQRKSLSSQKKS